MKIVFVGCVKSSYVLLNGLLNNGIRINAVVTKEKSKMNSDFVDLTPLCEKFGIDIYYTKNGKNLDTYNFIRSYNPDLIYCFGWSHLLSKEVIDIPRWGVVGFHPSKLPYNKGRHPIIWSLVLGLKETASTFFMIDEKADNGDIISQEVIYIDKYDDALTLYNKILNVAKEQVVEISRAFKSNSIVKVSQKNGEGNIWRKRSKKDGQIDFRMSANNIYNLVRALTKPYVGAHFYHNDNEYKVWKCQVIKDLSEEYSNIEYGKVLEVDDNSFLVKTGHDLLRIFKSEKMDIKVGDYL